MMYVGVQVLLVQMLVRWRVWYDADTCYGAPAGGLLVMAMLVNSVFVLAVIKQLMYS